MRVIYIDIDSARPDHFGCYGYPRDTTPSIDALAREGVRFTGYYASDTPCLPSRTALFTGQLGITSGVVNHGGTNADVAPEGPRRSFASRVTVDALAQRLRAAGLHTVSISPFPHRHSAYQIWHGFHETVDTGAEGLEAGHVIFAEVDDWLSRRGARDDWFLHVNFWDPHVPYDVPLEFGHPFADEPPPEWMTQERIDAHRASYTTCDATTPFLVSHPWPNIGEDSSYGGEFTWPRGVPTIRDLDDFKAWIDGYDTGMRYADMFVGRIVARLRELGVYEDTAIVISADHGEDLGELNMYGDHRCADNCTTNVPLVVCWPGVTEAHAGSACRALLYQVDLAPTLVELVGGSAATSWDGRSFADLLAAPDGPGGRPYLVLSHGASACQRSVRFDDLLMMRTYHDGFNNLPDLMLFDVERDPHETTNLASERRGDVERALAMLDQWVSRHLIGARRTDPLFEVLAEGGPHHAKDPSALCALLRATGRAEHADRLAADAGSPRATFADLAIDA